MNLKKDLFSVNTYESNKNTFFQLILMNLQKEKLFSATSTRHVWTKVEKAAIQRQLGDFLHQGRTPGRVPCLNAMPMVPVLAKYSWDRIKDATRNMIVSRNRKVLRK